MNLIEILQQPEGKTLEYKRDTSSPMGIVKTAIAFANTSGGKILIGIEDKTKHIVGIDNPLLVEEQLTNILTNNITPQVLPNIEIISWRDTNIVLVEIFPSASRPHYLDKKGRKTDVYIRLGSTNRRADEAIIQELKRVVSNSSFDEEVIGNLSEDDID